jgi:DNA-binding MarR family transcriptional regulator
LTLSATQRRTLWAFLRAIALIEPLQREVATSNGISLGDLYAVRVLARLGEVPVSRYGAELGLARSTITNLVDRLERAGLVARLASPSDRRVTLVHLTASGLEAMESRARIADSDLGRRLLALEESDLVTLAEILERVVDGHEPDGDESSDVLKKSAEPTLSTAVTTESAQ